MNIALLANLVAMAPLQRVQRWWTGGRFATGALKAPLAANVNWHPRTGSGKFQSVPQAEKPVFSPRVVPLRVVRVAETGLHRSSTGRMVISGRMADVCAELDRLVAREAEHVVGVKSAR